MKFSDFMNGATGKMGNLINEWGRIMNELENRLSVIGIIL